MLVAALCVVAKMLWMPQPNFFMDANLSFLGLSFVMFGLFNVVMLPMLYQTAYKDRRAGDPGDRGRDAVCRPD